MSSTQTTHLHHFSSPTRCHMEPFYLGRLEPRRGEKRLLSPGPPGLSPRPPLPCAAQLEGRASRGKCRRLTALTAARTQDGEQGLGRAREATTASASAPSRAELSR